MLISQKWVSAIAYADVRSGLDSDSWKVDSSPEEFDSLFIRAGFETEGYKTLEEIEGPLVIGRVVDFEELEGFKKPIRYCQVDVGGANGTGNLQGIVCGARNFCKGDIVVVSLPGTILPGGFAIAARKTYGKISDGMMCSVAELGLGSMPSEGIIVLPSDIAVEPGDDARAVLGLHDTIFDINVTPDRGYALSARGLAREIAAISGVSFRDPATDLSVDSHLKTLIEDDKRTVSSGSGISKIEECLCPARGFSDSLPIHVELDPETAALRFGIRSVRGINAHARTPFWMERELRLCGQRSVNLPTDITNYVMFLLGVPMHAFDADRINGDIHVRRARSGEKLVTLDHMERVLSNDDVVICDGSGIQSLAGVMGGTTSEIMDSTVNVFFEAAVWDPRTIARTSRRHKLSSEASRRFERGVDPSVVEIALDLACYLLVVLAGGTAEKGRALVDTAAYAKYLSSQRAIDMPASFPGKLAGVPYNIESVVTDLERIGCIVSRNADILRVVPPTWRPDLSSWEDLTEEVIRLEGLESIPSLVPTAPAGHGLTAKQRRRRAIGHALAYSGYVEILPTPFIATSTFDDWGLEPDDDRRKALIVHNPLESDHALLATTLLPSMLDAVRRNVSRGVADIALYGIEQVVFRRGIGHSPMPSVLERPSDNEIKELVNSLPYQPLHAATVGCGLIDCVGPWDSSYSAGREYSYQDAIESARVVARTAGVVLEVRAADRLPWHPGRCAELLVEGLVVGYAGELHPEIVQSAGLPDRTCAMELSVDKLPLTNVFPAPVLSSYPALLQDISIVISDDIAAEDVRRSIIHHGGSCVETVSLFDVYRSSMLGSSRKSLTFALRFRAPDRTLTDTECNEIREKIVQALFQEFGATLRA